MPNPPRSPIRHSTRGRWRALVLLLVHVAIAIHILHWLRTGSTLSPVEPSEGMRLAKDGLVNAGLIFFLIAILSTFIFGRFFCGWGCHLLALQDASTWLLKKIGLKPKPFRSRLLIFIPLFAAIYMFIWPLIYRLYAGQGLPTIRVELYTRDFWATFPGLAVALLTFAACGFLIVYLLGNKGFCTYACPYGGFFGLADQFALGRIRVTDDCSGCGHCTATCTSNVRVHQEVRDFGMVVDPGCMKCTDCISVCPQNALYFGFTTPAALKRNKPANPTPKRYDYNIPEELAMLAIFVFALFSLRGLYDAVPFLLALGLSAVVAFLAVHAIRLAYAPNLRLHNWQLRRSRRTTPAGWSLLTLNLLLAAFLGHALLHQRHYHAGKQAFAYAQHYNARAATNPNAARQAESAAKNARQNLAWCHNYGLLPMANVEAMLGSIDLFFGQNESALAHLRRAIELDPNQLDARFDIAEYLLARGDTTKAIEHLRLVFARDPDYPDARRMLVGVLQSSGQPDEARRVLQAHCAIHPDDHAARIDYISLLIHLRDFDAARDEHARLSAKVPDLPPLELSPHAHQP